jgi:hypothetical protein
MSEFSSCILNEGISPCDSHDPFQLQRSVILQYFLFGAGGTCKNKSPQMYSLHKLKISGITNAFLFLLKFL